MRFRLMQDCCNIVHPEGCFESRFAATPAWEGYCILGSRETGLSPSLPFSRCEAMGEGGRRPDEGSFVNSAVIFDEYSCWDKEPSPALRAPSPILADGRGGKIGNSTPAETSYMRFPRPCGEGLGVGALAVQLSCMTKGGETTRTDHAGF